MREELKGVFGAVQKGDLPPSFDHLFNGIWNASEERFHVQESYILDFKETNPEGFSEGYGAGFVRLALGFHNSFGGLIIVGVKDRILTVSGIEQPFDVESFNRVLTDFAAISIECVAKTYRVTIGAVEKQIAAVLVPRRKSASPVKLRKDLAKYKAGTLWVRDRHEVLVAETRHLPMLFSQRMSLPSDGEEEARFPVHRSFPPSPATLKEFISRGDLLTSLWGWFVSGENPRLYLHGPGGSGKSTLAFEFARLLAEHGHGVRATTGERLDYVIFISGKETELNPLSGTEQVFAMRQFANAHEQFVQIIYHSGLLGLDEQTSADEKRVKVGLDELFSHFSGLIVIDDIDALSRRGLETGEEVLFLKAVLAKQRTRILYTLRHPPQHALTSSLKVPGLDYASEFHEFVDACCKQFGVPSPPAEVSHQIADRTHSLPLLVETVVGLRRFCSNYNEALSLFDEKGGDDARRYLYQREYDRLDKHGKSRPILSALYLLEQRKPTVKAVLR
ncbi:AAA ATPase domain-containing protein (plasmid) [Rhizobium sp. N6212]|nr:AAA ATPase domain-containing protein [Rhizobium sp. N6212]ANL01547.1 AAA ATPase domain-containing protein [Rhizobium sp. N621]ANL07675.1 AAA ATPase domain-containing protein [Rhizobium esperanzae]ANL13845.1 AAA ATPase domain-containing protein [Rhizobium sp. N1341]ANL25830.1 AAA ATPase domain-containing protein [Rhizobium sp. N113]ANM38516.1 AAA ATPase domain-containing protein [Rhizobium sp. N871]ANM44670.1 AAA ATPase domain-containing protein [Rhizobium sp. N741]